MIAKITSKQNERMKYLNQLKDSSFRNKEKLFLVDKKTKEHYFLN